MKIKHIGRKILALFLSAALAIPLSLPSQAMSNGNGTGDNNTDLTGGTSTDYWDGKSGVRVTIMSTSTGKRVSVPIDYTEDNPTVSRYFGMNCKSDYVKNGKYLTPTSGSAYKGKTPTIPFRFNVIPVSDDDPKFKGNNVKDYFCKEGALKNVIDDVNANEHLTGTSSEFKRSDFDSGDVKAKLRPFTHLSIPECMYLERDDNH